MAKASSQKLSIEQLRPLLVTLAQKQIALHRRFTDYVQSSNETIGTIARKAGIKWGSLKLFSERKICLSSGRGLKGLCELLGCPELTDEILAVTSQIPDRYLGLGVGSPGAIELMLDLIETHQRYAQDMTYAEFADAFGGLASIVSGALSSSQVALDALERATIREQIMTVLVDNDFDALVASTQADQAAAKVAAGKRLEQVVEPLAKRYGGKKQLTGMLGIRSTTTLYASMRGDRSVEDIEKLTAKAEKLAKSPPSPAKEASPAPTSGGASPSVPDSSPPIAYPVPPELQAIGGATTEDGIQHVLTQASFQALKQVPVMALRDCIVTSSNALRLALNIAAQIGDDDARRIVREDSNLGREIEQLELAIRQFSFAYPNRLTELYEAQTQTFVAGAPSRSSTTPKRRAAH